ncbi:MAG: YjgP/YjgQ family permease [Firmicutes bacterium]|nr:YjgP/YjgQ family permease [Bacillota bacterium]NLY52916.1 YjgP/YjgQ family permease [Bacillota bacterium]
MRILDRYVAREMLAPMFFGICAFTSLFVGTDLLRLVTVAMELGAPLTTVGKLFVLRLPQIVVWTFPMAVLLSVLLALSRLSANSEIVAMKAGGLSFYRIALPALVIGILMTCATLAINELVVPVANAEYTLTWMEMRGQTLPRITRNVILRRYSGNVLSWFLYAARFDSQLQVMEDVTIVTLKNGRPEEITYAPRIVWDETGWFMEDGVSHFYDGSGGTVTMRFAGGRQPVDIGQKPREIIASQKNPDEMNIRELARHIEILRSQGAETQKLEVDWHLKWAIPTASIVFALVGAPLGLQSHRSASSVGFGLSIIVIFIYYVIMTLGSALAQGGYLPPMLGAWLQNLILGILGIYLMRRAASR